MGFSYNVQPKCRHVYATSGNERSGPYVERFSHSYLVMLDQQRDFPENSGRYDDESPLSKCSLKGAYHPRRKAGMLSGGIPDDRVRIRDKGSH